MYKKTGGFQCSSKDESANGATEANASWTERERERFIRKQKRRGSPRPTIAAGILFIFVC